MAEKDSKESQKGKTVKLEFKELTIWKTGTIVFAVLFIISLFTGGFGMEGKNEAAPGNPGTPQKEERANIEIGEASMMGDEDAPVTIIEYSDYQCPFCRKFWQET